ncbi:MAG: class I SAM-dependent methyltransferase [Deltaproteobacteria bacterium]|nr:class I SAM-dependent methyltransferase [Deltaproteobacteria bacterium]
MTEPVVAAQTYAHWRATTLGNITERVETDVVFDLAGPLRGKRVLDVGTGDGTYAIEAAQRGAAVTALDLEQEMLDAARARAASRGVEVTLQQGRAEQLPFADASFDVVIAVTVLCFVPDAQRAVGEMARVLAPGGRVILGELGRFSVWAAERRVRGWLGASTWRRAQFWSRRELVALAQGAGLHAASVHGAVFFPPSGVAARLMAPVEPLLTRLHAPGAAFLALAAYKREFPS